MNDEKKSELMIALRNAKSARSKGKFNDKYTVEACLKEVCGFVDKAIFAAKHQQMNDEKKIAKAILDAQKMREESYVPTWEKADDDGLRTDYGEYTKDFETCLIEACKQQGLSANMWCLLNLAMHWPNDIQLWAEDVLKGVNILDECVKENAKIKAEQKFNCEMVDDLVANDGEKLASELKDMNEALKAEKKKEKPCCYSPSSDACSQCRETDSSGNLKGNLK